MNEKNEENEVILECRNLSKTYLDGSTAVQVLNSIHFSVKKAERIAIIGPSGSGKSTLLHLLGGLDKATSGQVLINRLDWQQLSEKQRCQLRNQQLGFVYQFHHLLPEFNALENVGMPLLLAGKPVKEVKEQAEKVLTQVGMAHRLLHKPSHLSGGERQRVAIARALVHRPRCILADEPTGNLDQSTALKVFRLMLSLNETQGTALVIVTHDERLARQMDNVFALKDGILTP